MAAIFVSHSSEDNDLAREVKAWLDREGYEQVFLDIDETQGLAAGQEWERQLYENLERCQAVIALVTPAWMASRWCFAEVTQAKAMGKSVFPIIRTPEDIKIVGPELQAIQVEPWNEAGQSHLGSQLRQIADEVARGYAWDRKRPPWRGLEALDRDDAAIFFGRDPEIREVAQRLEARRQLGGRRFLMVVGASGSGKSSLMRAGILPFLGRERRKWHILPTIKPEHTPLTRLAGVLAEAMGRPDEWRALREQLAADPDDDGIAALVAELRVGDARDATVLVPIDQFEETITLAAPAERDSFLAVLRAFTSRERPLPVMVLGTVRSDLLDDVLEAPGFDLAFDSYVLGPLPHDRVRGVIEGPARVADIGLEAGLVDQIIADAGDQPSLPLVAFALSELNTRFGDDKRLTKLAYAALGDERAGLSPLQNAVRRRAEDTFTAEAPSPEAVAALKEAFVGALTRVSDDGTRLRRPAPLLEMPEAARPLIERLVAARLLTARNDGDQRVIEVAHEALFIAWPQLSKWLDEEADFLIGRRQIEQAEHLWHDVAGPDREKALLSGLLLDRARSWLAEYPHRLAPVREFVLASMSKDDAETAAREAERLEREAARERARRWAQRFAWGTGIAALIFAAVGAWAWAQRTRAEAETARAETQTKLAQQAEQDAKETLRASRVSQSRFLADLARQRLKDNRLGDAIALARQAVPLEIKDWPRVRTAENALALAMQTYQTTPIRPLVGLVGHEGTVRGAQFSPDNKQLLTWSYDGTARLWDVATGDQQAVLHHDAGVKGGQYFANGKRVLTWSFDGTVRLWDRDKPDDPIICRHEDIVIGAALSKDQSRLLSWSFDGTARLWDAASGKQLAVLKHDNVVWGAIFFADDQRILTRSFDGKVKIWAAHDGKLLVTLIHDEGVRRAALFDDEKRVLTWSYDKTARIWDTATGKQLHRFDHDEIVIGATMLKDGKRLLTWSGKNVILWDVDSDKELMRFAHDGTVIGAALSKDEQHLLTWSTDRAVQIWDVADGKQLAQATHSEQIIGARFSPDEKYVASWSYDGTALLWTDPTGDKPQRSVLRHDGVVRKVYFAGNTWVWTVSDDGTVRMWLAATGQLLATLRHQGEVFDIAGSGDGLLATFSADGTARIWDLSPKDRFKQLEHDDKVLGAVFTKDGSRLLSWSADDTARVWDADSGKQLLVLRHDDAVLGAAYDADESAIVTWSTDKTIRLWDVATGQESARISGAAKPAGAAYSANRHRLLVWFEGGAFRLWNTETKTLLTEIDNGGDRFGVVLSADGRRALTWSSDGKLRVIDVHVGEVIATFDHAQLRGAVFSPDGARVISWSNDGTVREWDVTAHVMLVDRRHPVNARGAVYSSNGKHVVSWADDNTAVIWDATTGKDVTSLVHAQVVEGAFFGSDDRIWTWAANVVRAWDMASGKELRRAELPSGVARAELVDRGDAIFVRMWSGETALLDSQTGEPFAQQKLLPQTTISPDSLKMVAWDPNGKVLLEASVATSVETRAAQASEIVGRLRPLSLVERCEAYIKADNCDSLLASTDRQLTLNGDEKYSLGLVNNGTAAAHIVPDMSAFDMEYVVHGYAEVYFFHSKAIGEPVARVEFNGTTDSVSFRMRSGVLREFGTTIPQRLALWLRSSDKAMVVQMDPKTEKALSADYVPVLKY